MIHLLDVNLLFVLHQPLHPKYGPVNRWFLQRPDKPFATCPITQSGMIRLLMQGIAGLDPFDVNEAREALRVFTKQPGHVFWQDDPTFLDSTNSISARMQGHRQTTDAYLLGLAAYHHGKLASLDRGIRHLAGNEFAANLEVIEA